MAPGALLPLHDCADCQLTFVDLASEVPDTCSKAGWQNPSIAAKFEDMWAKAPDAVKEKYASRSQKTDLAPSERKAYEEAQKKAASGPPDQPAPPPTPPPGG